jgi:glutamyl-tRNA reductase
MHTLGADYLVAGAGAIGTAFIDTLVSDTQARMVLVNRNHQPGKTRPR